MAGYGGTMSESLHPKNTNSTRTVLRWLWIIISSVFIFWVLFYKIDWLEVTAVLNQANYFWVTSGILITIASIFVRTYRWQVLLYRFQTHVFGIMAALLMGQAVNLVLPLRSGDLMRVIWFRELYGSSGTEALGTVAVEKVWDVLALFLCGLSLLLFIPLPATYLQTVWSSFLLLIIAISLLLLGLRWQKPIISFLVKATSRMSPQLRVLILPRIEELIRGVDVIRQSRVSSRVFLMTLGVWGAGILANWTVLAAFGVHSLSAAILLMVTLMSGNMIIPIPGRLGVFEAIVVGSLSIYGIQRDTALAIGLVLHMVSMGTPMIAAIILAIIHAIRRELITFFH
jgi:uncharacterized protein (TIRG00374 family)